MLDELNSEMLDNTSAPDTRSRGDAETNHYSQIKQIMFVNVLMGQRTNSSLDVFSTEFMPGCAL